MSLYRRRRRRPALALGERGTLFVGTRATGWSTRSRRDGDGSAEAKRVIARGLNRPNGVALRDGSLYVAEVSGCSASTGSRSRSTRPVRRGERRLPEGPPPRVEVHPVRARRDAVRPVGAPCNVCESTDAQYAAILRMQPDGTNGLEVYARGIRNTVGFDCHPDTGDLWFTDNGQDMLGDDGAARRARRCARSPACILDFPTFMGNPCATRSTVRGGTCRSSPCPRWSWVPTWPRWGCASAPGPPSRRSTAAGFHRRARIVEPQHADRLPHQPGAPARRPRGLVRDIRRGLAAGSQCLGPSRGRARASRRIAARFRPVPARSTGSPMRFDEEPRVDTRRHGCHT